MSGPQAQRVTELPSPAPVRAEESIAVLSRDPCPGAPPSFVIRAVIALRKFLLRLADLVVPPQIAVFERSVGLIATQLIGAVARHHIADLLESGPRTAAEIAARCGTNPDVTHRMMRA